MKEKRKHSPSTAEEFVRELQKDKEYMARIKELEEEQARNRARYMNTAKPVQEELAAAGFHVTAIREDLLRGGRYDAAVPILMKWIPKITYLPLKEDMIRALAVPWAKGAAGVLIEEFRRANGEHYGWAIGNSLWVIANDSIFDDISALVQDKKFGRTREMLALALGKMKKKKAEAVDVLLNLLDDDDVAGHALCALAKLKAKVPRERLEPFLKHNTAWIRKEAKKVLRFSE